jgi:hypothetical protein
MRWTCSWRHYAPARAVWCSWCTLEWLGDPYDELVIARAIEGGEGIWVASRFLTTMIHSALLVAVVWLQHTRCPRFRRGTVGYGITTSPIKRGRVGVRGFHASARWYTHFPNAHAMQCMLKSNIYFNFKVVSKTQRIGSGLRSRLDLWLAQIFRTTELDGSQLAWIMPYEHYCWKRCYSRHYIDEGFQNYQTTLGLTMQTSCNNKVPSLTDRNS